jgi:hypothetical protein
MHTKPARGRPRVLQPTDVLTTSDVARWFNLSTRSVERMRLPSFAPGRYLVGHVLEHLNTLRTSRRRGQKSQQGRPS